MSGLELWAQIPGYPIYEASSSGRVRSINRVDARNHKRLGQVLKPMQSSTGHLYVKLMQNGREKKRLVHRVVYETFVGAIPENYDIHHVDGNKHNNAIRNLKMVTHAEHMRLHREKKPVIQMDANGKIIARFESMHDAERCTGISSGNISAAARGAQIMAGGFRWEVETI